MTTSATTWMRSGVLALAALAAISTSGAAQERTGGWTTPLGESMLTYTPDPDDWFGPSVGCGLPGEGVKVMQWTNLRPEGDPAPPPPGVEASVHGWPVQLTLASGSVRETVTAWAMPFRYDGTTLVTTRLRSDHPVLAAFAETGEITLTALGETRSPVAAPLAKVLRMLAECRERPRGEG